MAEVKDNARQATAVWTDKRVEDIDVTVTVVVPAVVQALWTRRNAGEVSWLSCLLRPGETGRAERLEAAVGVARRHAPVLHRGDLLDDLAKVAAQAPSKATLVVYHSAVLAYVSQAKRQAFAEAVHDLGAVWLSNEGDRVLRCIGVDHGDPGCMLLVRDGRQVLA